MKYELVRTYIGTVGDVEVIRTQARSACRGSTSSHDCGQIINPDGLKNQIEGNVIQP